MSTAALSSIDILQLLLKKNKTIHLSKRNYRDKRKQKNYLQNSYLRAKKKPIEIIQKT